RTRVLGHADASAQRMMWQSGNYSANWPDHLGVRWRLPRRIISGATTLSRLVIGQESWRQPSVAPSMRAAPSIGLGAGAECGTLDYRLSFCRWFSLAPT